MLPLEAETLPSPLPFPHAREGVVARAKREYLPSSLDADAGLGCEGPAPGNSVDTPPSKVLKLRVTTLLRNLLVPWVCRLSKAGCMEQDL